MKEFKYLEQMIDKGNPLDVINALAAMPQKDLDRWEVQNLMGRLCTICDEYENAKVFFEEPCSSNQISRKFFKTSLP